MKLEIIKTEQPETGPTRYEPLNICCGEAPEGQVWPRGAARIYTLADVDQWAKGDLSGCGSPPAEVIVSLALAVGHLIRQMPGIYLTAEEYRARNPEAPYAVAVGVSAWGKLSAEPRE